MTAPVGGLNHACVRPKTHRRAGGAICRKGPIESRPALSPHASDLLPPRGSRRRRRLLRAIPAVAAVTAGSLALAPSAFANFITPKGGGSPNANSIQTLYLVVLIVAAVVFVAVEAALVYAVIKFRAKKHPVARQIHGNTRLEIGWTGAAAVILLILAIVTFIELPSIVNPPNSLKDGYALSASVTEPNPPNGQKLRVCVQGRQYIWRYTYGQDCLKNAYAAHDPYSYTTMVVPVHTTIVLEIQSLDVIHSWWIPSLGGKVDAVPGDTTYTWFQATHVGKYRGQCAQLCGWNHDAMDAYVDVVTPAQYKAFLAGQTSMLKDQNRQVSQLRSILTSENQLGS
jgi:cytochrome c oxidase subunit II